MIYKFKYKQKKLIKPVRRAGGVAISALMKKEVMDNS